MRCREEVFASIARAVEDAGPYGNLPYQFVGGGVLDAPPYNAINAYRCTA